MDAQETKKLQLIGRSLTIKASKKIQPAIDSKGGGGIHVVAQENLRRGDEILSCHAVSIALDPEYRHLCAYCGRHCTMDSNDWNIYRCCNCQIISICSCCQARGAKRWHEQSGECFVLGCLVLANFQVFGGYKHQASLLEKANQVDSSILLTMRIMFRRRWTVLHRKKEETEDWTSPFPKVEWELLDALYTSSIIGTSEETIYYDNAITALCDVMIRLLEDDDSTQIQDKWKSWMNKQEFDSIMGKVIGCGHAVTDVSASLGCQCLGRALFLEHSFYNHACCPNAYFSCHFDDLDDSSCCCALTARIHCIHDVCKGESVTISYIPTSGLDRTERRKRLKDSYNFECMCDVCVGKWTWAKEIEDRVTLPAGHEVDIIRNMQYECNQQLLTLMKECKCSGEYLNEMQLCDLQSCLSTIQMNKRGICNQNIPGSHEVSIESHRLHAAALLLSGDVDSALKEHEAFHEAVQKILRIFDPVAFATSLNEYAAALDRVGQCGRRDEIVLLALENLSCALGDDHIFTRTMASVLKDRCERGEKKRKNSNI